MRDLPEEKSVYAVDGRSTSDFCKRKRSFESIFSGLLLRFAFFRFLFILKIKMGSPLKLWLNLLICLVE